MDCPGVPWKTVCILYARLPWIAPEFQGRLFVHCLLGCCGLPRSAMEDCLYIVCKAAMDCPGVQWKTVCMLYARLPCIAPECHGRLFVHCLLGCRGLPRSAMEDCLYIVCKAAVDCPGVPWKTVCIFLLGCHGLLRSAMEDCLYVVC